MKTPNDHISKYRTRFRKKRGADTPNNQSTPPEATTEVRNVIGMNNPVNRDSNINNETNNRIVDNVTIGNIHHNKKKENLEKNKIKIRTKNNKKFTQRRQTMKEAI